MATRRSRIKAVANLPARRNRPVGSNEALKDETGDLLSTPEIAESLPSAKKLQACLENGSQSGKGGLQESNVSSHESSQTPLSNSEKLTSTGDAATLEESQSAPDRRSVIVSVDKDRKSVIVNRDDCINPINAIPNDNVCKKDSGEAISNPQNDLKKQPNDSSEKKPSKAHDSEGQVLSDDTNSLQIKPTESKASPSTDDTTISSKRAPLRNRRSKPAVNLTAATRKRSVNDISASPCSPPPVKLKSSEPTLCRISDESKTVTNSDDTSILSLASDENKISSSENTENTLPLSSPPVTVSRPSDNVNGVFKTPLAPVSKNKDVSNESTNKGDVTPVSPQKESSNIKRKPSSNAQRVATARKNLKNRIDTDGTPPRSALTMFDLIFYNPTKNPMKSNGTPSNKSRHRLSSVSSIASIHEDRLNEESVDDIEEVDEVQNNPEETVEETAMPVPQVKVGPDGSLILDEQSLVIETTGAKKNREELEKSEVIVDSGTGYGHYKKIVRSKDWSDHETKKFYRALNVVGTDFSLMKPYFRTRTRRELKLKFKKEERLNPNLITKALAQPLDFDISELEKECELEDEEEKRLEEEAKEKAVEKFNNKNDNAEDKPKKSTAKKKKKKTCVPLAEIGMETEKSSADEKSKLRKQTKKRRVIALSDEDEGEDEAGTSPICRTTKRVPQKKQKPLDPAEEDYNMLAMGLDMPSQLDRSQEVKPTKEQEDMGIFAEPKTKSDSKQRKEPLVKRIRRKAPNLPQQKPASESDTSLLLSDGASSSSQPLTNGVQKSLEENLKVTSTKLTTSTTAVHSTVQSKVGITTTPPRTIASTSGFKPIQSSTQQRIQVVQASSQSVVATAGFKVVPASSQSAAPTAGFKVVPASSQSVEPTIKVVQSSPMSRVQLVQSSPPSGLRLVQSSPPSRVQLVQSTPQPRLQLVQSLPPSGLRLVQSSPQSRVQLVQSSPQPRLQLVQSSPQPRLQLVQSSPQPRLQLVQSSPKPRLQLVQTSPQPRLQLAQSSSPMSSPSMTSMGAVTPKTYNIIRRPATGVRPLSTPENTILPVNALLRSCSSNSTCLVSSPGGKFVQSPMTPQIRTPQLTPQSSGFRATTPVNRLLPSTPLPRMEPGSIIVLKTPLPQNPDRHVLQVYMVTNTPPGSTANALPHSPGINLLSGPTVQPANLKSPPCMSDESDCEKVLTTL